MSLKTVGIVGAGTMGSGIAMNVAENAFDVRLVDTTREQVDAALGKAAAYFDRKVERGRMQWKTTVRRGRPQRRTWPPEV